MQLLAILSISLLFFSLIANIFLYLKSKKPVAKQNSIELQEFLADLMGGVGMVAVTRVDPNNILLRSPRNR